MNEHLLPSTSILYGVKPDNSGAPVYLTSACVPSLDLNGPTLRHFESHFDSPKLNQRLPGAV